MTEPIDFPTVLEAYLRCALWSSVDDNGNSLLDGHDPDDFDDLFIASAAADLADFLLANFADLEGMDHEQIGHDFWLTRNRHGVGFWDHGLGERGERLTAAAHVYGSVDLYVTDDGKIGGS